MAVPDRPLLVLFEPTGPIDGFTATREGTYVRGMVELVLSRLDRTRQVKIVPQDSAGFAAGESAAESDLFIQQTKLKNTLREWMGEQPVTHSEAG